MYKNWNKVDSWCNDISSTPANSCTESPKTKALATASSNVCTNISGPGFDSGWSSSAQYWDTANNRLLIDFERVLSWDIPGDSADKDGKWHIAVLSENTAYDLMVNYGVYTDGTAATLAKPPTG